MKRHLFTIISAVSLLLLVAMVALWVRSYWSADMVEYDLPGTATVRPGLLSRDGSLRLNYLQFDHRTVQMPKGSMVPYLADLNERARFDYHTYTNTRLGMLEVAVWVPHWFLMLTTAVLPMMWSKRAWKKGHRIKHGLCLTCGYDLRASKDRCPECGTPIPLSP